MHRFYAPYIERTLTLPDEEARHCVRVLRLTEGDSIEVTDGKGNRFLCEITIANAKNCMVNILEKKQEPTHWGCLLALAVAPTKNLDRMEWMTEKVTEMGIDEITPMLCDNSERRVLKTERLKKIAVSAMKQSLKCQLPVVNELTAFEKIIATKFSGQKFIAYCDPALPRSERREMAKEYVAGSNAMILIGPEGDFSPLEVQQALNAGFIPVSLGQSRLRTETAAVMACAMWHSLTLNQTKV